MRELYFFIINLRWHYQLFILSGCFLFGGLFTETMDWTSFLTHFLLVHLLLYGGATAYNTYWDNDSGPVGGLRRVPPMKPWMHRTSLLIQLPGLVAGWWIGYSYMLVYAISMVMFWVYSSPHFRWKGRPVLSLIAIGISTGWGGFWLGALAAGGSMAYLPGWPGAVGVMMIILSMYPISQLFQFEDDLRRGDNTFSLSYGSDGVKAFFVGSYSFGIIAASIALVLVDPLTGSLFFLIASLSGAMVWTTLRNLRGEPGEYDKIMRIKYMISVLFVIFIAFTLIHVHIFNMGKPVYPESRDQRLTLVSSDGY